MVSHHCTDEASRTKANANRHQTVRLLGLWSFMFIFFKESFGISGSAVAWQTSANRLSISILPRPDPIWHNGKGQHYRQMLDFHFSRNGSTLVLLVSVWLFSSITAFNTESLESRFTSIIPPPHSSLDAALSFKCKLSNGTAGSDGHYFHKHPRQRSRWSGATGVKGSILRWRGT